MNLISRMIEWVSGKYVKKVNNETIFGAGNIAGGGGGANWGEIGGTLNNQTDLKTALNNKLDKLTDSGEFVYTHDGSTQNSKGFIAGITDNTLLNSAGHIPSTRAVKQYVDRNGHLYSKKSGYYSENECIFDFVGEDIGENERVVENRKFVAIMADILQTGNLTGEIYTKQLYAPSLKTIYIEQEFTATTNNNYITYRRKGRVILDNTQDYTNWVATKGSSISWNTWVPIEYPSYVIDNIQISGKGQLSYIKCCICGGILIIRGIWSASSTGDSGTVYTIPVKVKIIGSGATTIYYPIANSNGGFCEAILDNTSKLHFNAFATGDYRIALSIPLGY